MTEEFFPEPKPETETPVKLPFGEAAPVVDLLSSPEKIVSDVPAVFVELLTTDLSDLVEAATNLTEQGYTRLAGLYDRIARARLAAVESAQVRDVLLPNRDQVATLVLEHLGGVPLASSAFQEDSLPTLLAIQLVFNGGVRGPGTAENPVAVMRDAARALKRFSMSDPTPEESASIRGLASFSTEVDGFLRVARVNPLQRKIKKASG